MVIGRSATRPTRAVWKTERSLRKSARAGARREGGRRDATSSTSAPTPTSGSGAVGGVTRAKDVRGVRDLEEQIEYVFDPTRGETGPVHLEGAIVPVGFPKGTYLRNGPNSKFGVGKEHYFDGDGMIHGITFLESGGVCYYNRWIETKGLAMENEAGRKLFRGILVNNGLEMLSGVLHNILFNDALSTNGTKDTTNTAVVCHGGRILALMEAQKPALMELKVTRDSVHVFRTKAKDFNFNGELGGNMCAHPKVDPHTGDMIFFSYNMTSEPHMVYTEVDRAGEVRHTMAVDGLSRGVMSHDMAITSTRAVLFDLPVEFSVANIARNEFPVQFQKEARARLGVVERGGSRDVEWFEVQRGGNVFHTVNAFDDERTGEVVLQAMRSEPERSGYIFNDYSPSYLHEWRLTPGTGRVSLCLSLSLSRCHETFADRLLERIPNSGRGAEDVRPGGRIPLCQPKLRRPQGKVCIPGCGLPPGQPQAVDVPVSVFLSLPYASPSSFPK